MTRNAAIKDGEQLDLIDVTPANLKRIKKYVRAYGLAEIDRKKAAEKKVKEKEKILEEIYEAELHPVDGMYRINLGDNVLEVKEKDPSITLKPLSDGGAEAAEEE